MAVEEQPRNNERPKEDHLVFLRHHQTAEHLMRNRSVGSYCRLDAVRDVGERKSVERDVRSKVAVGIHHVNNSIGIGHCYTKRPAMLSAPLAGCNSVLPSVLEQSLRLALRPTNLKVSLLKGGHQDREKLVDGLVQ